MGDGCCGDSGCGCGRKFMTKDEKMARLTEYQETLEQELKGVKEHIQQLKKEK